MYKKLFFAIGAINSVFLSCSILIAKFILIDKKPTKAVIQDTKVVIQDTKNAKIQVKSLSGVTAKIVGSRNTYTLLFLKDTDTASKEVLETALKGMVSKATNDTKKITFTGSWDTTFDASKDATYTYTLSAPGYNDVTFAITVNVDKEKQQLGKLISDKIYEPEPGVHYFFDDDIKMFGKSKSEWKKEWAKRKKYLKENPNSPAGLKQKRLFANLIIYNSYSDIMYDSNNDAILDVIDKVQKNIDNADTWAKINSIVSSASEGSGIDEINAAIAAYKSSTPSKY